VVAIVLLLPLVPLAFGPDRAWFAVAFLGWVSFYYAASRLARRDGI
jgi:hypothetical protein